MIWKVTIDGDTFYVSYGKVEQISVTAKEDLNYWILVFMCVLAFLMAYA